MLDILINGCLLGFGLAMDAFSVSLANGLNEPAMKNKKMLLQADGHPVMYTTDKVTPSSLPEEFAPFYESKENFASFTYTVPAGEEVRIKTTLKLID